MSENIVISPPPSGVAKPSPKLRLNDFDQAIWDKGLEVFFDELIKCPCHQIKELKDGGLNQFPSITCNNCGGFGYFLARRKDTKMVVQNMNKDTKFREWSEENLGTVSITCLNQDRVSFMDRIILKKGESYYNEVLKVYKRGGEEVWWSFMTYEPIEVLHCFLYQGDKDKHKVLVQNTDYTIQNNTFRLLTPVSTKEFHQVSIKYMHRPQYHILDIPRDIIRSPVEDRAKQVQTENFPIHAVGRRSHFVLDSLNFAGNNIIDNSLVT